MKRSAWEIHKAAVKANEKVLGVPLKRTRGGFYTADLPEGHPITKRTGNRKLLIKIVGTDKCPDPRLN